MNFATTGRTPSRTCCPSSIRATPEPADFADYGTHKRLTLRFDDIIEPIAGMQPPQVEHVEALLAFGRGLEVPEGDPLGHLLIHCHAGISRSSASMVTILAESRPQEPEDAIYAHIREIRPQAWPNSRMIAMADTLLGRGGRLVEALRRHYGEQIRLRPDLAAMITRVGPRCGSADGGLSGRPSAMSTRPDLTAEEWEALERLNRGPPEALLLPATILERLRELGLAIERGGQRRISDRGKQLILRQKDRLR